MVSLVRRWCGPVSAVIACALTMGNAMAAPPIPQPVSDPLQRKHPTDLGSFIELRDDYATRRRTITSSIVLRGDYAPVPWAALRLELPLTYVDKPDRRPTMGLGDVYARATVRVVASDVSLLVGTDCLLDSASAKLLGGSKNVVGPFATIAWDLGPGVWVRLQLQHLGSFGGDPKQATVSATSVRPYALVALPEGFWVVLDQSLRVDHKGTRDLAYTAVLEGGKELSKEVSMYLDPGVELDSPWALTWLMTGGVRWTMR